MLFQIDIKHIINISYLFIKFESNVILDRYKTYVIMFLVRQMFESNVILDRYKTRDRNE